MRAFFGRVNSCLYIRTTSAAALLTNRSTSSSPRIIARHSLKKCPDPVSAQPQRGVFTLAMAATLVGNQRSVISKSGGEGALITDQSCLTLDADAARRTAADCGGRLCIVGRTGHGRGGAARLEKR